MKEGTIKSVDYENYTLEHNRYRNHIGILQDFFNLIRKNEDGTRIITPHYPPIKINDFDRHSNIFDNTNDYSEEEMITFIKENITPPNN